MNKIKSKIKHYKDLIELDPSKADLYIRLMRLYRKNKEYKKADKVFNKAVQTVGQISA